MEEDKDHVLSTDRVKALLSELWERHNKHNDDNKTDTKPGSNIFVVDLKPDPKEEPDDDIHEENLRELYRKFYGSDPPRPSRKK
ncbi:MAG: hypothetical protein NC248_04595 [Bacteroides sp.]|nr:hypothetical protein [Bacteroides sp.]MCM1388925.1 hypothetical protein [Bacteroides sp.]